MRGLMAGARRSARERGKSDPIDAEAVARIALGEPRLPRASLAGSARDVNLMVDHRRRVARSRTAAANKLRRFLHESDPELLVPSRKLRRLRVFDMMAAELGRAVVGVEIARDLVGECRRLTEQINGPAARLRRLVEALAPSLLDIPGCWGSALPSSSVRRPVPSGPSRRMRSHTSPAGLPFPCGNKVRARLSRGRNRSINPALHMIAVTRRSPPCWPPPPG
ncbi:hypothetical protein GCM10011583_71260 [Streptomyces camponoticapitis]|uniref:Transposase IS111A/IS1328/IS1533 N-terminal domain-containing protein n=1 Tax=Streptomyces camponoticapitis TaxID=1616125 RepID=A0ABQ2EW22_9ACTN|nr:hypothetical protein GCM10011583_71260 [Streptomyces camponoticapitis]